MSRLTSFLCLQGQEIANDSRTQSYMRTMGVPSLSAIGDCGCAAYDDGNYISPVLDDAPWSDPTRADSDNFLGFIASDMTLESVLTRSVSSAPIGGKLGPLKLKHRLLVAQGFLIARDHPSMAYGERWLTEALCGSPCTDSGCVGDELLILPACPEETGYDDSSYAFRSLVNVGVVDGPVFGPVGGLGEWYVQSCAFQLVAESPYIYHPAQKLADDVILAYGGGLDVGFTTSEWMGDGTLVIDIENIGLNTATNITIVGQISLDGSCPITGAGTSTPPSYSYTIPVLAPGDRIVFDGRRKDVVYYEASCREASSGLPYVTFTGPFRHLDVSTCTTLCLTIENSDADLLVNVDGFLREK